MSEHLTIQIDPRHHSIYIYLRAIDAGGVARTESVGAGVLADLGPDGELLGVELLGPGAVQTFFSLVPVRDQFRSLRELEPKKDLLERLIA